MTVIRRPKKGVVIPATVWIFILLFVVVMFLVLLTGDTTTTTTTTTTEGIVPTSAVVGGAGAAAASSSILDVNPAGLAHRLRRVVENKRAELEQALKGLTEGNIPQRLKALRDKNEIIGERLIDISQGKETAEEILHGHNLKLQQQHHNHRKSKKRKVGSNNNNNNNNNNSTNAIKKKKKKRNSSNNNDNEDQMRHSDKPPMELEEVTEYLNNWIHQLHETLGQAKHATFEGIWKAYHDLTVKTLYIWDQEYLQRMPARRNDGSIFLSLASYRDEHCNDTLYHAYAKAKHPEKLFVGLAQQNCHKDCKSGVLTNLSMVLVPPDDNCYEQFCQSSELGKKHCHQVRLLDIDEPESLGPYAARYFTSKLWYGESWFMQIDAHMTFLQDWDAISVDMLEKAPSEKPVLSHYPPGHTINLEARKNLASSRLCGPVFAGSDLENQMVRLEGGGVWDTVHLETPPFAPFTAAGYFVSHSRMLKEVPFDPFLPWIFMGEEIIMSSRLWTSGYDIFSPTTSVVGHWYVRRHKPKFWESVHRAFTFGVHSPLQMMVLDRIKYQLGYPEADLDMLPDRSILTAVESYSMGTKRPLERYLKMIGMNMTTKQVTYTEWCEKGYPPPGFERYNHLYPVGVALKNANLDYMDDDSWGSNADEDDDEEDDESTDATTENDDGRGDKKKDDDEKEDGEENEENEDEDEN